MLSRLQQRVPIKKKLGGSMPSNLPNKLTIGKFKILLANPNPMPVSQIIFNKIAIKKNKQIFRKNKVYFLILNVLPVILTTYLPV